MLLSLFKQDPLAKSLVRGVWKVNHVIQCAALLTAKKLCSGRTFQRRAPTVGWSGSGIATNERELVFGCGPAASCFIVVVSSVGNFKPGH